MGFTLQEVEEFSEQLAQRWGNSKYRVSGSWLDRIELHNRALSAIKLIVLSFIYNLTPAHILAMRPGTDSNPSDPDPVSVPNCTLVITEGPLAEHAKRWLPDALIVNEAPENATLLDPIPGLLPPHIKRAIIGRKDRNMEPMIFPGSVIAFDSTRRSIAHRREWHNEFERPIYILFARTGFYCGFCELDRKEEWLTLVPHMLSPEPRKGRWRYRKEIEVLGTVTHISSARLQLPVRPVAPIEPSSTAA
ncbi:XRE family transcriptional regulator [Edaphobacter dinghuensis]|nr:XRE family transcriptional regulator [Edaphobacter dinghuensis]